MFIRAVWHSMKAQRTEPAFRRIAAPTLSRQSDVLGLGRADFAGMTRGLFDR